MKMQFLNDVVRYYMLKADLHIHTYYSGDSNLKPEVILEEARKKKLDAVGIIDHNTVKGALETGVFAEKNANDIVVLIGQEVLTKQGEIVVFGLKNDIEPGMEALKTCMLAKK